MSCILRGPRSVKKLLVPLTLLERRALSEQIHAINRLSFQVGSFQTRRAVIGNKLEKFHVDLFKGLCCHQLPFQSETVHRCVALGPVRQPYSNLAEENDEKKGQESVKREICRNFSFFFTFLSLPQENATSGSDRPSFPILFKYLLWEVKH